MDWVNLQDRLFSFIIAETATAPLAVTKMLYGLPEGIYCGHILVQTKMATFFLKTHKRSPQFAGLVWVLCL